nr:glutamine amidotransferase [Corynebacterium lactis]
MSTGRFLLVALRPADGAGQAEYLDFLEAAGLTRHTLDLLTVDRIDTKLPDLSDYDGVFVGGSPFNVTDLEHSDVQKHAHDLMYEVLTDPTPALFTCYGASYTAFTFGGVVNRENGETAGVSVVELTEGAVTDPLAKSLPRTFGALTGHKESVSVLPRHATLLATGPTCPVQMYTIGSNNWVTQFHPEMDAAGLLRRMSFYASDGYFEPDEVAAIKARIEAEDLSGVRSIVPRFVELCSLIDAKRGSDVSAQ